MFEMSDPSHLDQFALGCDADMGGYSTIQLAIQQSPSYPFPHGVFRGTLRSELGEQAIKSRILKAGGYAGFRTKVNSTCPLTTASTYHSFSCRSVKC